MSTKKTTGLALIVLGMAVANVALGDIIRGIDIDFVTIGHPGNPGDTREGNDEYGQPWANPYGCGAVDYIYRIGKYEISAAQWETVDAVTGIDDTIAWSGDQPAADISWGDAAQFCNYLTSGDKNLGPYQIGPGGSTTVDRASALTTYGRIYVLPTVDEWYKAAYYKPDGSGYSTYANGTESIPPADGGWNYYGGPYAEPWVVGTGSQEQNGTFDMMGNVWEWTESFLFAPYRACRGGCFLDEHGILRSAGGGSYYAPGEVSHLGFRVASIGAAMIDAMINIDPDTLNLGSKDKWVTCYIELPNGYDVMDIDGSTVKLEGIPAYIGTEGWARAGANSGNITDHDRDGVQERMVKFDAPAVQDYLIGLGLSGYVALTVTGDLVDGPSFEGIDVIRVTNGGN